MMIVIGVVAVLIALAAVAAIGGRYTGSPIPDANACHQCRGVGAVRARGALGPCPVCQGTGIDVPA